jgi:acetyl-CoA carboxylase biotin carboxyl carrier protein
MSDPIASATAKDDEVPVQKKRRSRSRKQKQVIEPSLNMPELRKLAALVIEHGFTDFEFENENIRVRLSKASAAAVYSSPVLSAPMNQAAPVFAAESLAAAVVIDEDAGLHKITSPIVGTFYRSPGPDKEAYVSEGSKVTPETTVCIVEAMKLMNEIQAEVSGEVVKIYVENGQPVEFGQPLFGIKK